VRYLPLTPKGMELMKDALEDVNVREFRSNMQEDMASYIVTVSTNTNGARKYLVILPKVAIKLSHFGTYTCGVPSSLLRKGSRKGIWW